MPVYVYEVVRPDGTSGERFEQIQSMSEPPLERHPLTGEPVRRVITSAFVPGKGSTTIGRNTLSDKNLEAKGFTKYVKTGDGQYQRLFGNEGPPRISADG